MMVGKKMRGVDGSVLFLEWDQRGGVEAFVCSCIVRWREEIVYGGKKFKFFNNLDLKI
jgi:hypothetical protein